jgi:hypothetical protein
VQHGSHTNNNLTLDYVKFAKRNTTVGLALVLVTNKHIIIPEVHIWQEKHMNKLAT